MLYLENIRSSRIIINDICNKILHQNRVGKQVVCWNDCTNISKTSTGGRRGHLKSRKKSTVTMSKSKICQSSSTLLYKIHRLKLVTGSLWICNHIETFCSSSNFARRYNGIKTVQKLPTAKQNKIILWRRP